MCKYLQPTFIYVHTRSLHYMCAYPQATLYVSLSTTYLAICLSLTYLGISALWKQSGHFLICNCNDLKLFPILINLLMLSQDDRQGETREALCYPLSSTSLHCLKQSHSNTTIRCTRMERQEGRCENLRGINSFYFSRATVTSVHQRSS